MQRLYVWILSLLLATGVTCARDGIDLMFKWGQIDNYSQRGLNLPAYDIESLSSAGGQLKISRFPVVDLIIGADYSWCNREYNIDGQILDFRARDMAITASIVYPLELRALELYAGGGIGSHSVSYEYRRPGTLILEDHGIDIPGTSPFFGYHAVIGGLTRVLSDSIGLFAELRLYRIDAPFNDISYNTWTAGISLSLE